MVENAARVGAGGCVGEVLHVNGSTRPNRDDIIEKRFGEEYHCDDT